MKSFNDNYIALVEMEFKDVVSTFTGAEVKIREHGLTVLYELPESLLYEFQVQGRYDLKIALSVRSGLDIVTVSVEVIERNDVCVTSLFLEQTCKHVRTGSLSGGTGSGEKDYLVISGARDNLTHNLLKTCGICAFTLADIFNWIRDDLFIDHLLVNYAVHKISLPLSFG